MALLAFVLLLPLSSTFLLDRSTQSPTRASFLSDPNFNLLMNLLTNERQSRIQLENYVKQLQQELSTAKQDVYAQVAQYINATVDVKLSDLVRKNSELESKNQILNLEYDNLKAELEKLNKSHVVAEKNVHLLSTKAEAQSVLFQQTVNRLDNRVAVTSCAKFGPYDAGVRVPFDRVMIANGLMDIHSMATTGVFTCERPGIYLAVVTEGWEPAKSGFNIVHSQSSTNSRMSMTSWLLMSLKINETISTISRYTAHVAPINEPCLTIIQIS